MARGTEDAVEHRGSMAAVQDFLAETLARAEPVLVRDADGRLSVPFTGSRDRISFVANVRGHGMLGGLYVFDIGVEPAEDGHGSDLVIGQTLFRPGINPQPPRQRRVLMRGVDSVTLRYFGEGTTDTAPGWHNAWSGSLPRVIEYNIHSAELALRRASAELRLTP